MISKYATMSFGVMFKSICSYRYVYLSIGQPKDLSRCETSC